jgi:hypothetical protein
MAFWPLKNIARRVKDRRKYRRWLRGGRPVPPPHLVKQLAVKGHAARHGTRVFVETGTLHGDMVEAVRRDFGRVYSIELSEPLHRAAERRFRGAPNVRIVAGDSGRVLPQLLAEIREPCLFWLDGHYSGGDTAKGDVESPILAEIDAIFAHPVPGHVILIDDARCFVGTEGYPTLAELEKHVRERHPDYAFAVEDDIIRIAPLKGRA